MIRSRADQWPSSVALERVKRAIASRYTLHTGFSTADITLTPASPERVKRAINSRSNANG